MTVSVETRAASVYRCYNAESDLLYVGMSIHPARRLTEHVGKAWWRDVAAVTVAHYEDVRQAAAAERQAIETERPEWNVTYSMGSAPRMAGGGVQVKEPVYLGMCLGPTCSRLEYAVICVEDRSGRQWRVCACCYGSLATTGEVFPEFRVDRVAYNSWEATVEFHRAAGYSAPGWGTAPATGPTP